MGKEKEPKFEPNRHRDELAHKLREIRNSDSENPELSKAKAAGYLDAKQETKEYQDAKNFHEKETERLIVKKQWKEWLLGSPKEGIEKEEWKKIIQELEDATKEMSDRGLVFGQNKLPESSGYAEGAFYKKVKSIEDGYIKAQKRFIEAFDVEHLEQEHPVCFDERPQITNVEAWGDDIYIGTLPTFSEDGKHRLIRGPIAKGMGITRVEPWLYPRDHQYAGTIDYKDTDNIIHQYEFDYRRGPEEEYLTKKELEQMKEEAKQAKKEREEKYLAFTEKYRISKDAAEKKKKYKKELAEKLAEEKKRESREKEAKELKKRLEELEGHQN